MVKTSGFLCRELGFDFWSGELSSHMPQISASHWLVGRRMGVAADEQGVSLQGDKNI